MEESKKPVLNRRDFMKAAAASCAVAATNAHAQMGSGSGSGPAYFGAFRALPIGAITATGWVHEHLQAQVPLATALPKISFPFNQPYWEGKENSPAWFTWENRAYWIDGATRLALLLNDGQLLATARRSIDYTLDHPSPRGFLGPNCLELGIEYGELTRWPNTVFFRAMMALADSDNPQSGVTQERVVAALRRHYGNDSNASYSGGGRNITNLEVMLWCYERSGDRYFLDKAEECWKTFLAGATKERVSMDQGKGVPFSMYSDLAPSRVYANTPIQTHGVSYAEVSKIPAILYLYTGNDEYRKFADAAQRRVFDHHLLIDGIPSSSEAYAGTTSLDEHETCDITDHAWNWIHVLMATGDGKYGDAIERACFNAHPGATKSDWKGIQYFSSPNQVIATLNSDHGTMRPGSRRLAYQPNPAQFIGCCGGNKHRFFPNYVMNMWMQSNDGGLAAVLYGPSKVTSRVGTKQNVASVETLTNYPFEDSIAMRMRLSEPTEFPLHLRIPAWCTEPTITVNGVALVVHSETTGFVVVRRVFRDGDEIRMQLPMQVRTTEWPNRGVGVERGPLVYALPVEAEWSSLPELAYSTAEFPTWEAEPKSIWNYGLAPMKGQVDQGITVETASTKRNLAGSSWPWADAGTELLVPVRRLEQWEYTTNPKDPRQRFTPPLPADAIPAPNAKVERLRLVPYGATQLRVSIFPKINA